MKIIAIIFVHILLSGCATDPKKEYAQILEIKKTGSVQSVQDAINDENFRSPLIVGEKIDLKLDSEDRSINIDGTISFYEVFSIEATSKGPMSLTSFSPIKSSPSLYIVWPRIFITDSSGNIISDTKEEGKVSRGWGGVGPLQYETNWNFEVLDIGTYYVLVTSDNRVLGEAMAFTDIPISYEMKAHSTGPIKLRLN